MIYTPVDQIPASARNAIRKAVQAVKDEVLVYNGSVCDAVWSASAKSLSLRWEAAFGLLFCFYGGRRLRCRETKTGAFS